jgi:hypothetical protein
MGGLQDLAKENRFKLLGRILELLPLHATLIRRHDSGTKDRLNH